MYKLLTRDQLDSIDYKKLKGEQVNQYVYSMGYYDVEFFIDMFLSSYKTDKKTGDSIESAPFHKNLIAALKSDDDTLVIVPRDHAKSTTNFFVLMHDICYAIEPSILLVMPKGLGLETIGKIRDEMETNIAIKEVFGKLVPGRTREEANKRRTQSQLQFLNGVSIESVTMGGSVRGKRPTKVVVDDPQENSDVRNPVITDQFNNWFFSTVINTLDPTGKCIAIGTIVGSLCLVNFIYEQGRGFNAIKHEAIIDAKIEKIDGKRTITAGTPLWEGKRSIASLQKRMDSVGYEIFMQEFMNVPYVENGSSVYDMVSVDSIQPIYGNRDLMFNRLEIFGEPSYCYYGVDTATGVDGGDYSTIVVRNGDMKLLAQYRDRVPPHKLCDVIDRLRKLGYTGQIGIERNNSGISTLNKAEEYSWNSHIYAEKSIDKITNKKTKKAGWSTNAKSKPLMIDHHAEMFHEKLCEEYSEEMIYEMRYYYRDEKGSTNALAPHHDDLIIADAICLQMAKNNVYIKAI